jgi:hypothetical protein
MLSYTHTLIQGNPAPGSPPKKHRDSVDFDAGEEEEIVHA